MQQFDVDMLFKQIEQLRELKAKILELKAKYDPMQEQLQRSFRPYTAIIVEPRKHRALSFVVRNFLENLEPNWSIQIHHGTSNQIFVENLLDTELSFGRSRITLKNLGVDNLAGPDAYSRLFTNRQFIENVPTEMFLVFQTDSMINPDNKELIHDFMEYDYVGAPWGSGLVGNGGLSLRNRNKMLEILDSSPPYMGGNEDMYFAINAKRLGFNVPSAEIASKFSIETVLSLEFFGVHRVWGYHPNTLLDLCMRCPGLNDLISLQDVVDDDETIHTAIIVEPRKHKALSFVIRNILENLPDNWNVLIHHGNLNQTFVENLLDTELSFWRSRITLKNLGIDNLPTPMTYSRILASREFTEKIPTETFIIFQTDSMINPNHKDLLGKFLKYDYVGAPWPWDHLKVGNGGFSLRKRSKMLKIIHTTEPYYGAYEDQYFSVGSRIAQSYKPTREEAMEFSIEQVYSPRSFAIHNAWKYLPEKVEQMCKDCPGLDTLMSLQGVVEDVVV
jgi:hypothetical protein